MLKTGRKAVRSLAFIVAMVMMLSLVPTMALADEIGGLTANYDANSGKITVSGSITTGGKDVTLLAVKIPDGKSFGDLTDADLQSTIVYIDQFASNADGSWTKEFTPREVPGKVITIYAGGENVNTAASTTITLLSPAPTVTLSGTSPYVWGTGEITLNVAGSEAEEWVSSVTVSGVDASAITRGTNTISIDLENEALKPDVLAERAFTLSFDAAGFAAVSDISFKTISAIKAALDATIPKATVDSTSDESKYTITVPDDYTTADGASVAYSVTVDGATQDISTSRTFDVARGDEDKTVVVSATISATGYSNYDYTVQNITVRNLNYSGPGFDESAISFTGNNVYGKTGYRVITIDTDAIDPATQTIKVGDVALFYSPVRRKFVGIVNSADAAAALASVQIEDTPSVNLYYGKPTNPSSNAAPLLADAARTLALYNNTWNSPTDAMYLSADVLGTGSMSLQQAVKILAVLNGATPDSQFLIHGR